MAVSELDRSLTARHVEFTNMTEQQVNGLFVGLRSYVIIHACVRAHAHLNAPAPRTPSYALTCSRSLVRADERSREQEQKTLTACQRTRTEAGGDQDCALSVTGQ